MRSIRAKACAAAACGIVAAMTLAAFGMKAAAGRPQATSPLAGLPSPPGPHIAQIQALGDNTWLELPLPAADPTWGRCRGRSWGSRAAYSPDLRAGFYYGEGNHGWYNDRTRRSMDDLWAYDVMANRWICLYPGSHLDELTLTVDANGFEVDATGQPIPVNQSVHGYELLTYDTHLRKFMMMPSGNMYDNCAPRRALWGIGQGHRPVNCSPWFYDVATGRFELRPVSGAYANDRGYPSSVGDNFVYIPSLRKSFLRLNSDPDNDVWFYDYATNSWTEVTPSGPRPASYDACTSYDPKRERIYFAHGNTLSTYDLATNAWSLSAAPNAWGTNHSFMNYDSVNDVAVMVNTATDPQDLGVFVYDPGSNAWTRVSTSVPAGVISHVNAFYDPFLNAHFVHSASDNNEGPMWVYRYKGSSGPGLPTVTIAAPDAAASEPGSNTASLVLTRSGDTTAALQVTYTVGGTATPGSDYAALPGSVTIAAGQASATITLSPLDDALAEASETVIVTLSPSSTYGVGSPASATVTIADDEAPSADADGDGLPDAWEKQYFTDLSQSADGDPDGDGHTNLAEYQGGSDPTSAASVPGGGGGGRSGNRGKCGAAGLEALLILGLLRRLRR